MSTWSDHIKHHAMGLIWREDYERLSSLLAHLGVDGGIDKVLYEAVELALETADGTMVKNAINSFDPKFFERDTVVWLDGIGCGR